MQFGNAGGLAMKAKFLGVAAALVTFGYVSQASAAVFTFYDTQAAFNAASSTTLLDDFSFPPGSGHIVYGVEQIGGHGTSSITRNGVTYSDVSGTDDLLILAPGDYWNFGANVGTTTDYVMTTDYDEHIQAMFSTTYTAVGLTAYFNGLGPGTLTVFGIGGSVIGLLDFPSTGDDPATGLADRGYLGFTSTAPITGFQWDTTDGGILNTGFSNLSVGEATPLPAAFPLFATGLGAMGLFGWRRKRKNAGSST